MSGQPTPPTGKGKGTLRRSRATMPGLSADATLFDVSRTVATACAVPGCQAMRLPAQDRVITCAHDLQQEHRRTRPRGCLNAVRPEYEQVPY